MSEGAVHKFYSLGFCESATAQFEQPDRFRFFDQLPAEPVIAQGAGLSLVGAGFRNGGHVIGMRAFNRILSFDDNAGTIEVEAGVTLGRLFKFLAPKKWSVAVQPGFPSITIGGCIAGNVHGKNQYSEGCFGSRVETINLVHPRHGYLTLSESSNPELFDLTIGGYGLTGVILSARLRLAPLTATSARIQSIPVSGLAEACQVMTDQQNDADFIYSWHDMSTPTRGQGLVFFGTMLSEAGISIDQQHWSELRQEKFAPPFGLMNRWSIAAMNKIYRNIQTRTRVLSLWNALFPFVSNAAYFYLYGRRGFIEHQVLIPNLAIHEYLQQFKSLAIRHSISSSLVTLKLFKGTPRLLHFSGNGVSLAVEVPAGESACAFFADLDRLDCDLGCRTNAIKDARLPVSVLNQQYPEAEEFRQRLRDFDPVRQFRSVLSERLGL